MDGYGLSRCAVRFGAGSVGEEGFGEVYGKVLGEGRIAWGGDGGSEAVVWNSKFLSSGAATQLASERFSKLIVSAMFGSCSFDFASAWTSLTTAPCQRLLGGVQPCR